MGRFHIVGLKSLPRFGGSSPAVREAARPGGGPCPNREGDGRLGEVLLSSGEARGKGVGEEGAEVKGKSTEEESSTGGWVMRLVRWLSERLWGRRNPFEDAGPRLARTVVPRQGCLKLGGVQVVRNDLSDTDFEVVPARRGRASRREVSSAVACEFRVRGTGVEESAKLQVSNL